MDQKTASKSISDILEDLAHPELGERLSMGELIIALGERGYGILLMTLAAPCALPIILPGLAGILGIPLIFLTLQIMIGVPAPWLPKAVKRRSILRSDFGRLMARLSPWLKKLERALKPRLIVMSHPLVERFAGIVALWLALLLSLPIPLSNIPLALPIVIIGAALAEHDGLMLLIGLIFGTAAAGFFTIVGVAVIIQIFHWMLSAF